MIIINLLRTFSTHLHSTATAGGHRTDLFFFLPSSFSSAAHRLPPRPPRRIRKKLQRLRSPPPPDPSLLSSAISSLPPRFSSDDLSAALLRLPDPRLCPHLLSFASSSSKSRLTPSVFLSALRRLGRARLYTELSYTSSLALSLIPSPPENLCNTMIYFFVEARMLSRAIGVYKLMRNHTDPTCKPTTRTYNILFAALLGRGANSYIHHVYMESLRSLFRQMIDAGVQPDIFSLNSLIKGYAQSLHLNDALRIFHQMVPVYGCEPNEHTYNYLVHGLCAQERTRNARELFDEMRVKKMVPSTKACNSIVSALAMEGELEEAVKLIRLMGKEMERFADRITCCAVLEGFCRKWSVKDALQLLQELRDERFVDGPLFMELMEWMEGEFGRAGGGCDFVPEQTETDVIPVPQQFIDR